MTGIVRRRPVTQWLVEFLRSQTGIRIELMSAEDHQGTKALGWQGEPSKPGVVFEPYSILIPQWDAMERGAIGHNVSEWNFSYLSTVFGTSVDQAEDVSDDFRQACTSFRPNNRPRFMMGSVEWSITRVDCTAIGGVGWNNQISPAMYSQTDSFQVTIGRS